MAVRGAPVPVLGGVEGDCTRLDLVLEAAVVVAVLGGGDVGLLALEDGHRVGDRCPSRPRLDDPWVPERVNE